MAAESPSLKLERILTIITHFINQTITEAEHDYLDNWLVESDYNMSLFETLTHPENAKGLNLILEPSGLEHFDINIIYDGQKISAVVVTVEKNRYQIWMDEEYKFTIAAGLDGADQMAWYLLDKDKYVPYVEDIGKAIELHNHKV